jgi:hypothetical protein
MGAVRSSRCAAGSRLRRSARGRVSRRIDRHGHLGPTFSDRALAEIVAARAAAAGLEGDFARHSLRAGFATAGRARRPLGGRDHAPRALESVQIARRYIRQGDQEKSSAGG